MLAARATPHPSACGVACGASTLQQAHAFYLMWLTPFPGSSMSGNWRDYVSHIGHRMIREGNVCTTAQSAIHNLSLAALHCRSFYSRFVM
jgi:hypothetical protein